ncbi:MotE family protein [Bacteriovorax sp. Seq25_V]|uniref:MotE family protein n=1 Tax=Bacteriovorax sp. Seq25_V TaxID=1201288 RepID=UPI00038A52E9|nr:hypothetical protein [Bacteriovorax sp. Seq25_V]EQC44729.1 hypothetical protein M900_0474 [Bacteriovorax sp. Seq25_V]
MKSLILISILAFLTTKSFAQESKKSDKLEFTKEEFQNAVYAELEKKMKKIGRSKLLDFSKELLQKEEAIAEKEEKLKLREEQLKLGEEELKKKFVEFKSTQENFLACIDKEDTEQKKRISHMVNVVSGMRPATAAELLSQQDPSLSVKILGMLEPAKVSKIFNLMDKEISARLQKQYMTLKK